MRDKISWYDKLLVILCSFGGVIGSFICAKADGYSHWSKRLLYFTGLSNIWIGLFMVALIIMQLSGRLDEPTVKRRMYVIKYVLTISISITAIIFCAVLAPFSERENYNAWTFPSLLTHVFAPSLTIIDFFLDSYRFDIKRKHVFATVIPLLFYLVFASVFIIAKVDFGRGNPYPYVFFNYYSPAGIFGFSNQMPYIFGSFYWMVLFFFLVMGLAKLYAVLYKKSK